MDVDCLVERNNTSATFCHAVLYKHSLCQHAMAGCPISVSYMYCIEKAKHILRFYASESYAWQRLLCLRVSL